MAYQDTAAPAQTLSNELSVTRRVMDRIGRSISGFFETLARNSDALQRVYLIQRLNEKTDEELAELNIRREDIVRHAFRDILYI